MSVGGVAVDSTDDDRVAMLGSTAGRLLGIAPE
jgi:hypothetical protein